VVFDSSPFRELPVSNRLIVQVFMRFNVLVCLLAFGCLPVISPRPASAQSWSATNIYNDWTALAVTADGSKIAAASFIGDFYTSADGGATWLDVASPDQEHWPVLAGSADGGNLVAAFYGGAIYISANWGGSWQPSSAPVDHWNCLASSADGTKLVAGASPGLLYTSHDAGATFTSRLPQNNGYQAIAGSADGSNLVALVYGGKIYRSTDLGETWVATAAPIAQWAGVASSSDGVNLAAITAEDIYTSTNSGVTWEALSPPNYGGMTTNGSWSAIVSSADGSELAATLNVPNYYGAPLGGGLIYISTNSGASWAVNAVSAPGLYFSAIQISQDGTRLTAIANRNGGVGGAQLYYSMDSGTYWVEASAPSTNWSILTTSADGSRLAAAENGGLIYSSPDFGDTWVTNTGLISVSATTNSGAKWATITNSVSSPRRYWSALASSADGSKLVATVANGGIFTSSDSGATWVSNTVPWQVADGEDFPATNGFTATNYSTWAASGAIWTSNGVPSQDWSAVYSSADGNTLLALARYGWSFKSTNGGVTWVGLSTPYDFWQSVVSSADGSNLLAAPLNGYLFHSTNAGVSWQQLNVALGTNIFVTNSLTSTTISTNTGNHTLTTNVLTASFASTNILDTSSQVVDVDTSLGLDIIGAAVVGANEVSVVSDFGSTVAGASVFAAGPFGTNFLDATVLRAGSVISSLDVTNAFVDEISLPLFPGQPVTNSWILADTNFQNVVSGSVSNVNESVADAVGIRVAIANMPEHWAAISSSADGVRLAAAVNGGGIYTSTNSGFTWSVSGAPNTNWSALALSSDGYTLVALSTNGLLSVSADFGVTWATTNVSASARASVAVSANGAELLAAMYPGYIYSAELTPVAHSVAAPETTLTISAANGNIILSWPVSPTNWILQQRADASATSAWTDVPAVPIVTNGENQLTLPLLSSVRLYRLRD
jgi:hypothetical protein